MPKHAPIDDFFRTARDAYVLSLFGIFFAPLFEELFFRGLLYPALARRIGMIPSILVTALAFASIHGSQLKYSWGPVLVIFLVGVTLTTVRAVKKSVGATVLMHMAYNGTIFVAAYIATDGFRHLEKLKFSWVPEIWSGHVNHGAGTHHALCCLEKYGHAGIL